MLRESDGSGRGSVLGGRQGNDPFAFGRYAQPFCDRRTRTWLAGLGRYGHLAVLSLSVGVPCHQGQAQRALYPGNQCVQRAPLR